MGENIKCIIHVDDCEEDIKKIADNNDIWKSIKSAASRRSSLQKSSKYTSVIESLPDEYQPWLPYILFTKIYSDN